MRSFWGAIGRVGCHCHCLRCIEKRHVHVRRLISDAARARCGQSLGGAAPSTVWTKTATQQRYFSVTARQLGSNRASFTNGQPKEAAERHSSRSRFWHDEETTSVERLAKEESEEEWNLKREASELQSMSIDHWSLDDVVRYEPMPGGQKPPVVPSTTTADPNYMMPQSPWAPDALKRQNYARVWTRKKIAKMETAMATFAVRICMMLRLQMQQPSNLLVLPEAIRPFARLSWDEQHDLLNALNRRMKWLANREGYLPSNEPFDIPSHLDKYIPRYEHHEDGLHHHLLRDLNASIVELFDGYKAGQLDFFALLIKICHNLLVSSAPPNVQTMNILLLGFYSCDKYRRLARLHVRHIIMDWLVTSCLHVKIRPNEITCAVILAMYRRSGRRAAFAEFVVLMRGIAKSGNALMFTRYLRLTQQSSPRLTPVHDEENIFKQAVYPSPMIFSEIIKGVVKFYDLRDAVAICKELTAKEWGYNWSCLQYLLQACITQRDWECGLWVWSEIKQFRAAGHAEPISILAAMLALCVQCQQETMFAEVLSYSRSQLVNYKPAEFIDMATEILNRAVDRMNVDELIGSEDGDADAEERAQRSVYGSREHERKVYRRLGDDPRFRYAVFGFRSNARDGEEERRYVDSTLDPQEDYEREDEQEDLILNRARSRGNRVERDLMVDAEGGDEIEELENRLRRA